MSKLIGRLKIGLIQNELKVFYVYLRTCSLHAVFSIFKREMFMQMEVVYFSRKMVICLKGQQVVQLRVKWKSSVTRLGDLSDFGQLFKVCGDNQFRQFLDNFCKGVKIFNFSIEIIFGNFLLVTPNGTQVRLFLKENTYLATPKGSKSSVAQWIHRLLLGIMIKKYYRPLLGALCQCDQIWRFFGLWATF